MSSRWRHIFSAPVTRLLSRLLLLSSLLGLTSLVACSKQNEPEELNPSDEHVDGFNEIVIYETDSEEWRIKLFKEHLLYSEAVETNLPAPFHIPSREEAQVLKSCSHPHGERFITSDGYTFGMPSASVSKAESKTQYSVLGLYIRSTVITIEF